LLSRISVSELASDEMAVPGIPGMVSSIQPSPASLNTRVRT
jgi:hypothetical protein